MHAVVSCCILFLLLYMNRDQTNECFWTLLLYTPTPETVHSHSAEMELHWFLWRLKSNQCIFGISFRVCVANTRIDFTTFQCKLRCNSFACVCIFFVTLYVRKINRIAVDFCSIFVFRLIYVCTPYRMFSPRKENWSVCGGVIILLLGKIIGMMKKKRKKMECTKIQVEWYFIDVSVCALFQ